MKKIEKFLLFFALTAGIIHPGSTYLNPPKKKDYFGRIILSLLGLIIFLLLLGLLLIFIGPPIMGLFK